MTTPTGGIFLVGGDGALVEMREREYDSEDVLQELLAKYPSLLAGDLIDPASPRRWLAVARESAVPSEAGGSGRWAIDNLFLDQDAVPTLVEVKRRSDTRLRREVIGQLLEYAANAAAYWPADVLRTQFEAGCERRGRDPVAAVSELLGPEADAEAFWQRAQLNLRAGRLRLVFVADVISAELRRIVEFLNEQMTPAEVLAVEVKQYVGGDVRTLVPRVFGQTAEAAQRKSPGPRGAPGGWTEASFFARLGESVEAGDAEATRDLYNWLAANRRVELAWGKGGQFGAFHAGVRVGGWLYKFLYVKTEGVLQFNFGEMKRLPVDAAAVAAGFRERLNRMGDVALSDTAAYPHVPMRVIRGPGARTQLVEALAWLLAQLPEPDPKS